MPSELPPEEDRPSVPIAPPLLFVLPILASLALEWFVPTSFVHGAVRWTLGALFLVAGVALNVGGFVTQKRGALIPSRSIRARASSRTDCIASPATRCTSVSLCGRLGWRSWWIPHGCSSPCPSASSLSIASSSRAKNAISSASSERNISTTNAVSGAGSSVDCADRIRLAALEYEKR